MVFCIGNRNGGDDAVGPYIADQLLKQKNPAITVVDCGITPENYTSLVKQKKPQTLIFIDAVEMGLQPGEIRIVPKGKIGIMHISTHGIPLSVLMKYLGAFVNNTLLIGIQPKRLTGKLTETVKKSGDTVVKHIEEKTLTEIKILRE